MQRQKVDGGARGWGRGMGSKCLARTELRLGRTRSSADGWGDGCTALQMHLIPRNRVLKKGEDAPIYPKSTLRQAL